MGTHRLSATTHDLTTRFVVSSLGNRSFGMKSGFIPEDKAPDELIAGTERGGELLPSEPTR